MDKGWNLISGGGGKETLIKNPATNSSKGGAYADIELHNPTTNQTLRINTVDTYADGITPTVREAAAAGRIQGYLPNDQFIMIPKPKAGAATAGVAAGLGAGSAQASDGGIFGSGISWGDVGNFLIDFIVPGGVSGVGAGSDIVPRAPTSSYAPSQSGYGGAAGGGFLLYPNKANTNMMRSVYSK